MAIYRFSMKHGSRAKGASAGAHARYVLREEKYGKRDLMFAESGNLPEWSERGIQFWDAADLYEAENARLYTEFEISMPRELDTRQQILLIQEFIKSEIGEQHPYTVALHEANARDGGKNPHVHLMFSTRKHDDYRRSERVFFKRANSKEPWEGGARKDRSWIAKTRLVDLRETWEHMANSALKAAGEEARVDARSLADQGIDRAPQPKLTPFEYQLWQQGIITSKVEQILVLEEIALFQKKQHEVISTVETLDKITSLCVYLADVEGFLSKQHSRVEDFESRRETADRSVDSLTSKLDKLPKTSKEALQAARSVVYGRAYVHHREVLKTAQESYRGAVNRVMEKLGSPGEVVKHLGSFSKDIRNFLEIRKEFTEVVEASRQFSAEINSEKTERECRDRADELLAERESVEQDRNKVLEHALWLRQMIEQHEKIAGDVSKIVADVAADIKDIREQVLPPTIRNYLDLDAAGAEVGQKDAGSKVRQDFSEQLEQAYKLEYAQRLGENG